MATNEVDHAAELRRCADNSTNKLFADRMRAAAHYIDQMHACFDAISGISAEVTERLARH